ncbi:dihydroorotase [bacterium]|jgi:dihydroorotase|nr:dihydroorotase [bacterium]
MIDSLLIKNVQMVLPEGIREGDLLVRDGKIVEIAPSINASVECEINEKGLTLMPGVIDSHVHFRDPGVTHKESIYSGARAAASGGVTTFFDMPNTIPSTITAEAMAEKKQIASETSLINYNFYIGATSDNLDVLNTVENVAAIKIFVGSSTGDMLVDDQAVLESIFANGSKLIAIHSEDEGIIQENVEKYSGSTDVSDHERIRSPEAAIKATKRLCELADRYKRRLQILHLTTQEETEFLRELKSPFVTTEACVQHFLLHGEGLYDRLGTFAQINPPLREDSRHAEAIWAGLMDSTIGMVVTDHAPHLVEEKKQPFGKAPSGMPGVETSLSLMLNLVNQGKCSLEQVVQWMCHGPAATYNVEKRGSLRVGNWADLTLVDMNASRRIESGKLNTKSNWSAFDGWNVQGLPLMTFVNGQLVYREGDFFESVKGQEVRLT